MSALKLIEVGLPPEEARRISSEAKRQPTLSDGDLSRIAEDAVSDRG
ncbi:MAG: hypothetical protein QGF59_02695 [Pirellulaceae bacterium]|nr:hypothetical protein [Pirellulaceae bacterium]